MVISLILGVLGFTASWLAGVKVYLAPLLGIVVALVPFAWLLHKRVGRLKKFAAQLPDALELVARALRAGHSLAAGMHVVAEEMPAPIADEFNRVYEEQNLGIPIEDALKSMCERVPNLDLRFFVTSVGIQRQTGGDLAEILDKIGYVIRERFRILGQVKALTAEGRLSGVILIALPFVLVPDHAPHQVRLRRKAVDEPAGHQDERVRPDHASRRGCADRDQQDRGTSRCRRVSLEVPRTLERKRQTANQKQQELGGAGKNKICGKWE